MNVNQMNTDCQGVVPITFEDTEDFNAVSESVDLSAEQHKQVLAYLRSRLSQACQGRANRLGRYASIDQSISTWQKLSPEDSVRQANEESTGRQQALPINMPLISSHVEDTVSFFTEVFAPVGGQFFATPGKKDQVETVKTLTSKLEEDMKQSSYYAAVASTMRTICKYNIGGFIVEWREKSRLTESDGNIIQPVDVYNLLYDPAIQDVSKLHSEGEWVATMEVKSRMALIRMAEREGLQNLDKLFSGSNEESMKMNSYEPGKAEFYKHPPSQTRIDINGSDSTTGYGERESKIDWDSYGLGLGVDQRNQIEGYEVVTMYSWINPKQFKLDVEGEESRSALELWKFRIADGQWIISAERVQDAKELPVYLARLNVDEMSEATRSLAEHVRPFQRFISFLLNTHVASVRKNVWGTTVYDPSAIDASGLKTGDTAALLASKVPNRDVRSIIGNLNNNQLDTTQNIAMAGEFLTLMRQIFPNQALPSQIAGMDRAVSSQVSAVMQGAMRKMHMLVRVLDSLLMLPVRMAMYRNIALFDVDKSKLAGITPEEVANLLGSGLGQINREAAAEQLRTIIFALIQNPEGNQTFDMSGLFRLWSVLMNIGTDLSEFITQAQMPPGVDPNAQMGVPEEAAQTVDGMPQAL
jgi:hypothetical protein